MERLAQAIEAVVVPLRAEHKRNDDAIAAREKELQRYCISGGGVC
jgi:hypothetical protein